MPSKKPVKKVAAKKTVKPSKPAAKPVASSKKAAPKPTAKTPAKKVAAKVSKPAVKSIAKPTPKAVKKPVAKVVTKPAAKTTIKPTAKVVAKPAVKTPVKPAAKVVSKSAKKPAGKPIAKAIVKPSATKKLVKPIGKSAAKPATRSLVKPVAKHISKPAVQPIIKPTIKEAPAKPIVKAMPAKPVVLPAAPVVVKKLTKQKPEPKPTTIKKPIKKDVPLKEVKVPKISVSTRVIYDPEYRSMENRTKKEEVQMVNIPLIRYSDSDLNEFRDLIQKKLDLAKRELSYLQGLITRKDDMGGDESENRYMTMEDGSISMEREQLSQMASRQITYIDHLEKALIRIENKTYGICRVTGKLIDKNRLRAVPHATLSLEAKLGLVKGGE